MWIAVLRLDLVSTYLSKLQVIPGMKNYNIYTYAYVVSKTSVLCAHNPTFKDIQRVQGSRVVNNVITSDCIYFTDSAALHVLVDHVC